MPISIYCILDEDTGKQITVTEAATKLGLNMSTVSNWYKRYEIKTVNGLRERNRNKHKHGYRDGIKKPAFKLQFSKGETCYKGDFRFRCKHYLNRITQVAEFDILPIRCSYVFNNVCLNYAGERVPDIRVNKFLIESNEELMPKYERNIK